MDDQKEINNVFNAVMTQYEIEHAKNIILSLRTLQGSRKAENYETVTDYIEKVTNNPKKRDHLIYDIDLYLTAEKRLQDAKENQHEQATK